MPLILATQVRAGMIVNFENELCRVISVEHQTPGNLPARVQVKMKRLKDGINRENRFGSSDKVDKASLEQHMLEYLYEDGRPSGLHEQRDLRAARGQQGHPRRRHGLPEPNMQVEIEFYEGQPMGVTLPPSVVLEIVETEPVMKNANATGSYKPAKLDNGITVGVPPYMEAGAKDPGEHGGPHLHGAGEVIALAFARLAYQGFMVWADAAGSWPLRISPDELPTAR